jgi:hypothetical protein
MIRGHVVENISIFRIIVGKEQDERMMFGSVIIYEHTRATACWIFFVDKEVEEIFKQKKSIGWSNGDDVCEGAGNIYYKFLGDRKAVAEDLKTIGILVDIRDQNFVCGGCCGDIVEVGKQKNGRKIFNCSKCNKNELLECAVCNLPKSMWADNGTVCFGCYIDYSEGSATLSREQEEAIAEWVVIVPVKIQKEGKLNA